jgi:hypothetical protein
MGTVGRTERTIVKAPIEHDHKLRRSRTTTASTAAAAVIALGSTRHRLFLMMNERHTIRMV